MNDSCDIFDAIQEVLSSRDPNRIEDRNHAYFHAAVLMPIFVEDGDCKVLFTKRTNRVDTHKGQISFPGGAVDEEDETLEETALREAHEEIGLLREDVKILGRTDDTLTVVSNFVIHPFVGTIPYPYDFKISAFEVRRLISVPLHLFLDENALDPQYPVEYDGMVLRTPAYEYNGDVIWGATARIVSNFVDIVGNRLNLPE